MTALAANTARRKSRTENRRRWEAPVAASTHIYQGSVLMENGSGYAVPAASATNNNLQAVLGVAVEEQDNSSGSAGDLVVRYEYGHVEEFNKHANVTTALLGQAVAMTDDDEVNSIDSTRPNVGTLDYITSGGLAGVLVRGSDITA